jgi:hypothetical protein
MILDDKNHFISLFLSFISINVQYNSILHECSNLRAFVISTSTTLKIRVFEGKHEENSTQYAITL